MVFNRDANAFQIRVQARCTAGTFITGNHQIQVMPHVIGTDVLKGRKTCLKQWELKSSREHVLKAGEREKEGLYSMLVWDDKPLKSIATDMHHEGVNPSACGDDADKDYLLPTGCLPSKECISENSGVAAIRNSYPTINVLNNGVKEDIDNDEYVESFAIQGFQRICGWQDISGHSPLGDYPNPNVFSVISNSLSTEFLGYGVSSSVNPRPRGPLVNF
jgi:hypothetical protein